MVYSCVGKEKLTAWQGIKKKTKMKSKGNELIVLLQGRQEINLQYLKIKIKN